MASERALRVFLSYARADRARVARLAEALTAAGLNVWWDTAIEAGSKFSADIERELEAADAVVVAWSAASVKSNWVLDEAGNGRDRGRLVPVLLDGTHPPLGFRQFQATNLKDWKGRADDPRIAALVAAIHRMVGGEAAVPPKTAAGSALPRWLVLTLAAVLMLALAAWGGWHYRTSSNAAAPQQASLAVLPFANLSGDPAQAYFADGLAEELRSALARVPDLKVTSRVSSEKYRDVEDPRRTASELGVGYLLTGSVRRSPTTMRVAAQLIDGRTGLERWSNTFDLPSGDIIELQSQISSSVATAMKSRLNMGGPRPGATSNSQALDYFLQARFSSTPTGSNDLALLDKAIALDPGFADAVALQADILNFQAAVSPSPEERGRLLQKATAKAQQAVKMAPASGLTHAVLARSLSFGLRMREALGEAARAEALSPDDIYTIRRVNEIRVDVDPASVLPVTRQQLDIDPFDHRMLNIYGLALLYNGQYEKALAALQRAEQLDKQGYFGPVIGYLLILLNRDAQVRPLLDQLDPEDAAFMTAVIEARAGNRAASDVAIANLKRANPGALPTYLASVYAFRRDKDATLLALETAWQQRDPGLSSIAFAPEYDFLRNDPRFKAIQDKVIPPDLLVPLPR